MKIFHLVHWKNSGIYAAVESLSKHGVQYGHTHHIEVLRTQKGAMDFFKSLFIFFRFLLMCHLKKPDAVNLHSFFPNLINLLYKSDKSYAFFHSNYPYLTSPRNKDKIKRYITTLVLKKRNIVSVSNVVKKSIHHNLHMNSTVCFNLIKPLKQGIIPLKVRRFGSAGRFDPEKRMDSLVNRFVKLEGKFNLYIAGDGVQLDKIRNIVKQENADNITLLGQQNYIENFFSKCDAYICCSKFEGFGLAITEAMAAGKIIISTRVGVLLEEIPFCFIELKNDLSNFNEAINQAAHLTPDTIRSWIENNNHILDKYFSVDAAYKMYLSVIKG